jgi:hypothetical protein
VAKSAGMAQDVSFNMSRRILSERINFSDVIVTSNADELSQLDPSPQ